MGAAAFADTAGTDHVYLSFVGGAPICVARYEDPPVTDAVSGDRVMVAGTAFLQVRCPRVAGIAIEDHGDSDAAALWPGHDRFRPPDTKNVIEVVRTGFDGATLTWTIGLRHKARMGLGSIEGIRSGPIVVIAH